MLIKLAESAENIFWISKDSLVIEPVRINKGAEENEDELRKLRGEDDEEFQMLKHHAVLKGNAEVMYKIGHFYYFGLKGLRCDHAKAMSWFLKAIWRRGSLGLWNY